MQLTTTGVRRGVRSIRLAASLLIALTLAACDVMSGAVSGETEADEGPATIGALQGSGPRSPFEGREVAVQAIVTGNFVTGLDGFFVQDAAGAEDGDADTSDGVFVQWNRSQTPKVRRGDRVRITGKVIELGNDSEQTVTAVAASRVEVLGRGGVSVMEIGQPPSRGDGWERYEAMWLRVTAPLTVTGNSGLARFGELEAAFGGRLFQPTERHPPGTDAVALGEDNARRLLVLDDNRRGEFPEKLWFLADGLSPAAPLRAGSELVEVEGVLNYGFGRWRLQLTEELRVSEHAPRPPVPELPAGLRIASVNLENFFNGDGRGAGFPTPRGATSLKEFQRQTSKTVALLAGLLPDVLAASEVENDGQSARSAEAALLGALNAALGENGDYRSVSIPEGASGGDQIRVGLFYRESKVMPVGNAVALNEGPFQTGGSRPPLAQAFKPVSGGDSFVVVANHFKSKGGCPLEDQSADDGDRNRNDFQSCWNATRVASAQHLHDWLQTDPTGVGVERMILLGDFNSYAQEDPLRLLHQLGWRDAFDVAGADEVYSYVHTGLAGRLDHALVTAALAPLISGAAIWHTNSDEAEAFDYRINQRQAAWYTPEPYRTSDHDPLLIGLDFSRR